MMLKRDADMKKRILEAKQKYDETFSLIYRFKTVKIKFFSQPIVWQFKKFALILEF